MDTALMNSQNNTSGNFGAPQHSKDSTYSNKKRRQSLGKVNTGQKYLEEVMLNFKKDRKQRPSS